MLSVEDKELWNQVAASVRKPGDPHDPLPSAPMHLRQWSMNPAPTELDLHGLTLAQAFDVTKRFFYHSRQARLKQVTIITGRSGAICAEFPAWCSTIAIIREIKRLPNGGSFRVFLKAR